MQPWASVSIEKWGCGQGAWASWQCWWWCLPSSVGGWIMAPGDVFVPIPGTCECYWLGKRDFAEGIKDLEMERWSWNYLDGSTIVTRVLIGGREQRNLRQAQWVEECRWPLEAEKDEETDFPLRASRRTQPCPHLDVSPRRIISNV